MNIFLNKLKFVLVISSLLILNSELKSQTEQSRASWMKEAKFGVMNHYLADWKARENNIEMTVEKWNEMIDSFDVEGLADQLKFVGAGYYIITIGQNSGHYLSPNSTYDKFVGITPGKCSKRDLVVDLYEALNKRGIRLMVYLPSGAPNGDSVARDALEWKNGPYRNKEFQLKWEQVIREWSERWGNKIAGWWFDGCYWPNHMYRTEDAPNFKSFAQAARAGNPESALAFCPGIVFRTISITPYEDYIAGEMSEPEKISIKHVDNGYVDGKLLHMLSYLGEKWGIGSPRFTNEQIIDWSSQVVKEGGAVTWDVPVQANGLISQPFLDQLKTINNAISKIESSSKENALKTFSKNPNRLIQLHDLYLNNKLQDNEGFKELVSAADSLLNMKPVSVMDKSVTPPSGDKHDYMSRAPYWWPNPNTADGLPYVQRDGERNPEISKITDHTLEKEMTGAVGKLSLAYYITKEPKYSRKAAELLRVWYLDDSTKMNPNLNYAQGIPGICTGRGIGIIELASIYIIIDAINILETSGEWTEDDDKKIRKWFEEYHVWLTTSKYGIDELNWHNNHGSWYDVQVASIAMFLGKKDLVKEVIERAKIKRIDAHIQSDGKQPFELERTRSWHYSIYNLDALFHLAYLGGQVGVDLWKYESPRGGSIRKALDFLLPFTSNIEKWEYKQIERIEFSELYPLLNLAEQKIDKNIYAEWRRKIFGARNNNRIVDLVFMNNIPENVNPLPPLKPRRGTSPGDPDAQLHYTPGVAPEFWSVATAQTIMARYPDYRTAYWKNWTYVQGYMFYGFEMLYNATGDKNYLDYMKKYIDNFVDADGNYTGDKLTNLDNLMTGNSIAALYHYTGDDRYKKAATEFRKVFDTYPRSKDGQFWHGNSKPNMWIDGIFMGQMFAIGYGKYIGDQEYCYSEAAKQITVFAKHCLKGNSGLYLHAWTENPKETKWADTTTGLSPEVWSEGLGWYALVIVELLAVLPIDHPQYSEVLDIYMRLADGLKNTQDNKTGGWWMIVDKGDQEGNWIDPSGTAMFVYSLKRGIELELLDKNNFNTVVERGYNSLFEFVKINENGLVDIHGGGDGIVIKKDFDEYINVARIVNAKEAVGGFLWASAIMEKGKLEKLKKVKTQ